MSTASHRPAFAPHVCGTFPAERRYDAKARAWDPIWIGLACQVCGATERVRCHNARPREKTNAWALSHVHRDPLGPERNPGSGR